MQDFVGTPERLSALRGVCLTRDRHRCVITRAFDLAQLQTRRRNPPAKDDDGNLLDAAGTYNYLEVAHIIPFAMMKNDSSGFVCIPILFLIYNLANKIKKKQQSESKTAALNILNMFDVGVRHLIEGVNIDRPRNALTLTPDMHRLFGNFDIFFERVEDRPHTYRIDACDPFLKAQFGLPIVRSFLIHDSIDPPSERLLALHSAVGHVLHLSGAGDYINRILRDMEDGVVREDGSTRLGALVNVALTMRG